MTELQPDVSGPGVCGQIPPRGTIYMDSIDTPIGPLTFAADDAAVRKLDLLGQPIAGAAAGGNDLTRRLREEIAAYFAGELREFTAPTAPAGTEFQRRVWSLLSTIPFGATWTYRDLAIAAGDRNATRAVGGANGKNPLPIVIPCHRVIAADGSLGGFSAGLAKKQWLLDHEQSQLQRRGRA